MATPSYHIREHNRQQLPREASTALVIGASGGIGSALYQRWQAERGIDRVIGISRLRNPDMTLQEITGDSDDTEKVWILSDYSEESIARICEEMMQDNIKLSRVCICNGILHNEKVWPDKRIEEIDSDSLLELFRINATLPVLWLKHLLPLMRNDVPCIASVFSARIGSISDNRLGGWYGYRASKAALNMMLKTTAIEFARRAKNVKLIAFHPGTTDTNLSRPFLGNVKHEVLQPDAVADSLVDIMNRQSPDGEISYIDWEDKPIEW